MMQGSSCCRSGAGLLFLPLSSEIMPQWINNNHGGTPLGVIFQLWPSVCVYAYLILLIYCVHSGINAPFLVEIFLYIAFYSKFLKKFYWSVVDLQCCASFRCPTK